MYYILYSIVMTPKEYKTETIKACNKIISLYSWFRKKHNYFKYLTCPLCNIYFTEWDHCKGCPLSFEIIDKTTEGSIIISHCHTHSSYLKAEKTVGFYYSAKNLYDSFFGRGKPLAPPDRVYLNSLEIDVNHAFQKRKAFYKLLIEILEEIPEEQFGPSNWKPLFYTGYNTQLVKDSKFETLHNKYIKPCI